LLQQRGEWKCQSGALRIACFTQSYIHRRKSYSSAFFRWKELVMGNAKDTFREEKYQGQIDMLEVINNCPVLLFTRILLCVLDRINGNLFLFMFLTTHCMCVFFFSRSLFDTEAVG
jgi:hypothetical protein